ncbi:MAG: septal ring lytic transglycosylase RlpA family protein [Lysobacter sp.]|nr:septal ring lytic transglycosylase RlpA family protein [Lysobacter sp.]
MKGYALVALILALAACGGAPKKSPPPSTKTVGKSASDFAKHSSKDARRSPHAAAQEDLSKRGDYIAEGLYAPNVRDGAPSEDPQVDLIPEPQPKDEPRSRYGNRPYKVLGTPYAVMNDDDARRYSETGMASWYGAKFHGRRTSSLEVYDMYTFSGAHKTLPLPSYVRVTNLGNGKSLIVRVNDRGPFHPGRIIDLSYAAAMKLGVNRTGTAKVHVQSLDAEHVDVDTRVASIDSPVRVMSQAPSIAMGLPASTAPATTAPAYTAIDTLIAALPIGAAAASERKPAAAAPPTALGNTATPPAANSDYRFDMRQDGKAMTAGEFDAWMQARRVRVATGKPGQPDALPKIPAAAPPVAAARIESPQTTTSTPVVTQTVAVVGAGDVTLQVASFASQQNAGRALAMLQGAGIGAARLQDAQVNGQKVWRLRVGPLDGGAATELSSRISGLGFGAPRVVRD